HLAAQFLACLVENPRRGRDRLARPENVAAVLAHREKSDGVEAGGLEFLRALDGAFARAVAGRGKGGYDMPLLAAEQVMDRYAPRLPLDVMQANVDGGNRRLQHAPAFEILAAIHLLPDAPDLHCVLPDQEFTIVIECARDGEFTPRKPALTPAEKALVGLDLDQQLVPDAHPDGVGLDGGDLEFDRHGGSRAVAVSWRAAASPSRHGTDDAGPGRTPARPARPAPHAPTAAR